MGQRHKRNERGWQRRKEQKAAKNPLLLKPKGMTRGPLAEREIEFHRFREALGEARFVSFLAHIRKERGIKACARFDGALNEGKSLLGLVLTEKKTGYWFGFRKFALDRWVLAFGYRDSPLCGEWAEWIAKFGESGEIAQIRIWRNWIS